MVSPENNADKPGAQCAPATIPALFAEWLPLFNLNAADYSPEGLQQALSRIAELRTEIGNRHPITAKDMAQQLVALTNGFEFDMDDERVSRVVSIATRIDPRHPKSEREQKWDAALQTFKAAAMEYDPTILGFWVSSSEQDELGRFSNVDGVWFSRSRKLEESAAGAAGEVA